MRVRLFVSLVALAVLAGASATKQGADADHEITGHPDSIAGLGDSITRAVNSDALGDRPENSWVTGTNASVDSIYSRLLAVHPPIAGNRFNEAVSGARMTDLDSQAQAAVAVGAELVTVFMGANDVCTSSEASMTPVATFQAQFETAMATLASGLPDGRISVLSIPDIHNLWTIHKDNAIARIIWNFANICHSMLANPLSNDPADVQRRANVRQRNMDFNDVLNSVCAEYIHCKFDDYLGFNTAFTPAHVSTIDYFHPSIAGQALIAQLAWDAVLSPTASPIVSPTTTATASPTATPTTPELVQLVWSDLDCSGDAGPRDSLVTLRVVAALPIETNGCPEVGSEVSEWDLDQWVLRAVRIWGDADCNGEISLVDVLDILLNYAGLDPAREPGCPEGADGDVIVNVLVHKIGETDRVASTSGRIAKETLQIRPPDHARTGE